MYRPGRLHTVLPRNAAPQVCRENSCSDNTVVRNSCRAVACLECIRGELETYASWSYPDESDGSWSTGICPVPPHKAQSLPSVCRPTPWQRGHVIETGTSAISISNEKAPSRRDSLVCSHGETSKRNSGSHSIKVCTPSSHIAKRFKLTDASVIAISPSR